MGRGIWVFRFEIDECKKISESPFPTKYGKFKILGYETLSHGKRDAPWNNCSAGWPSVLS
jgi:hypothetical protein